MSQGRDTLKDATVIFKPDPGEVIVSMAQFRGELYVATSRRVLVWDRSAGSMQDLKLVEVPPETSFTGISG